MLKIMNKKMLAGALAAGIVLSSTGCNNKEDIEVTDDSSNYLDTSINVNRENDSVLDTSSDVDSSIDVEVINDDSSVVERQEIIDNNKTVVVADQYTYIYKGNSEDTDVIGLLLPGESLVVNAGCRDGWYQVRYELGVHYVKSDFVHEEKVKEDKMMPIVTADEYTYIYKGNSEDTDVVGALLPGESLVQNGGYFDGWYQVKYDGCVRYVLADSVHEANLVDANYYDHIYISEDTNVLGYESKVPVGTVSKYETFDVYDKLDDLYLIKMNDTLVWINREACRALKGNYVVVDISDQKLEMYNDNSKIFETYIVSGKDSTPSDIGLFRVYDKSMNVVLRGDDYETPVTYWMPYNGGEGLHDAYWRYEFGGDIYHFDGSHGCMNMSYNDAEYLYNNLEVGDKVLVKE